MAKKRAATPERASVAVSIKPPNMKRLQLEIEGTAPLVLNRFAQKAMEQMRATQEAGSTSRSKRKRDAKNFDECYQSARHISIEGWDGIPAPAIRNGSISVCRTAGFKMTLAKLAIFVEADGFDRVDGTPLIRITHGKPEMWVAPVRLPTGQIDLRARPMWAPGWKARPTIRYDAEVFTHEDVVNLISRLGMQVGIGEGRPDSKNSAGLGFGLFQII